MCFDLVVPAVVLLSNSSENLFAGMFLHTATRPLAEKIAILLTLATLSIFLCEADGATGNDKLFAYLASKDCNKIPHQVMCELHWCANHSHHLAPG